MFGIQDSLDVFKGKGASRLPKMRDLEMIGNDSTRFLFAARQGDKGFGEDTVLFSYDIPLNRIEMLGKVKGGEYVTSSCQDESNAYFGTRAGMVVKFDKRTGKREKRNFENTIDCMITNDDAVFIGVNGRGVYKLDKDLERMALHAQDDVVTGLAFIGGQLFAFDYCGSESGNWPPVRVMNAETLRTIRKGDSPGQVRYCVNIGNIRADWYLLSGGRDTTGALFSFNPTTLDWKQLAEIGDPSSFLADTYKKQLLVGNSYGSVRLFAEGKNQGVSHGEGKVIGLRDYKGKVYAAHSTGKIKVISI